MSRRVAIFWPGDYRPQPNQWARPSAEAATRQLEAALRRLGSEPYRVGGFITRPHESIERLGPINDPMIGVCVHWFYGTHTTDGVVGKDNPLLLASNFSGRWPGLVGLLNTAACLESLGRPVSRIWSDADDWSTDETFMARLEQWRQSGRIDTSASGVRAVDPAANGGEAALIRPAARAVAERVAAAIRERRVLALMLGDTSMGMINGYFGIRELNRLGITEHKVDQSWILERGRSIAARRIDDALRFVQDRGVAFHWRGVDCPPTIAGDAEDFSREATCEQLRDYLAVADLLGEFKADCLGWQYQLGLLPLRPPSDFAEGLLNSACRPESSGQPIVTATEADQGNLIPMELMKRLLTAKGLHGATMFHDVRWGGWVDAAGRARGASGAGRFAWVLLNSGSSSAFAFNHDPDSLRGVHSYRQPTGYFPVPGGTFAGESLPGPITWARAWLRGTRSGVEAWMDIGRGAAIALPPETRDEWWNGTTRQWPLMVADLGVERDTLLAHYMSNHIAVAYGDVFEELIALAEMIGLRIRVWGR